MVRSRVDDDGVLAGLVDDDQGGSGLRTAQATDAGHVDALAGEAVDQLVPVGVVTDGANQLHGQAEPRRCNGLIGALAPTGLGETVAEHSFTRLWQARRAYEQ